MKRMPVMTQSSRKDIVRSQFNRQAQHFSKWPVTTNQEYARAYFNFCAMTPDDRLLDISCGTGDFCIFCAQNISHATGVDLSEKMIALAIRQSMGSGAENTAFRCGDASNLPYRNDTFSIVISKSAFHHYSNHTAIFREMIRCCSRHGRISVQDIVAYDDAKVNDFFESFERMVDPSHKVTCSKSFIRDLYQQNRIQIVSALEVPVDLNMNDYLKHAVRSEKDTVVLRQVIKDGLQDDVIKNYFYFKGKELFFKRNVFLVLGRKEPVH